MGRFVDFLEDQISRDLERLQDVRRRAETGQWRGSISEVYRGFRECEMKTRLLALHRDCGTGRGRCDRAGCALRAEDDRGCPTLSLLGLPYADRAGYLPRWRP